MNVFVMLHSLVLKRDGRGDILDVYNIVTGFQRVHFLFHYRNHRISDEVGIRRFRKKKVALYTTELSSKEWNSRCKLAWAQVMFGTV